MLSELPSSVRLLRRSRSITTGLAHIRLSLMKDSSGILASKTSHQMIFAWIMRELVEGNPTLISEIPIDPINGTGNEYLYPKSAIGLCYLYLTSDAPPETPSSLNCDGKFLNLTNYIIIFGSETTRLSLPQLKDGNTALQWYCMAP
jgi:hypothetical protein